MKKFHFLLPGLTLITLILVLNSCKKDDPEPTFNKSDLIGVWEATDGKDFIECIDDDGKWIEITEKDITESATDENTGCSQGSVTFYDYDFNGNTFDIGGLGKYKVISLQGDKMEMTISWASGDSFQYKFTKE